MSRSNKIVLLSILAMLATAAVLLLLLAALNHIAIYARLPHVEHVRRNADAPHYLREVESVNANIRQWQDYNRKWWIDWAVPDGWNDVPLIKTGNDLARHPFWTQKCVR